ncbi:MAG: alpha/beta fold hydrolase [Candidatus Omnitrophota bacterium]|nr:alpha/beta fold hydrolase [Candidatus Omnitrophota bacterium]
MQVGQFETEDSSRLYYNCWPAGPDDPCVIYLHGLESHMGWFSNLAEFLNLKHINVYAFDRRGSGINKNNSRNFTSRYLSSDLKIFIDLVKREHPKSGIFLIGLCLGGRIAVDFFSYHQDRLDGLILISPSLKNKLKFSLLEKLSILFRPNSLLKVPIEDAMFTSNKRYLDYIANDFLRLRYIPAQHLLEIAKMGRHLKKASGLIKLPILLMLAGIDEIIDTDGVRRWFELLPSPDKTLKFYKDFHHLLTFEENADLVMEEIAAWIKGRAYA